MRTKRLVVEQEGIRSVRVRRTVVLEVPENSSLDPTWIRRDIATGDKDYGPFPWQPTGERDFIEVTRTRVVGDTAEEPDVPFAEELPFSEPKNSVEKGLGLTPLDEPSAAPDARVFRGEARA